MRGLVLTLSVLFVFALPLFGFPAEEQKQESASQVLSSGDVKQLKEAADGLRQIFGIEELESLAETDKKEGPQKKTIADVADKAVDMAGRMVSQAAEQIQKVAPDVWRIMIKQQYAKAIALLIVPAFLFVVAICYHRICRKYWKYQDERAGSDERACCFCLVHVVPFISGIAFSVWFAIALSFSIKYLVNPEFYAIRDMLLMILGKGTAG